MRFDGHLYSKTVSADRYTHKLFETNAALINSSTGFDMIYQENKVHNLKLAARTLNGLLIKPGETFSFWQCVRHADKHTPYKDGLTVKNGMLDTASGGGLCQMSNLLFWIFLHSPLTIIERHTHRVKHFPTPKMLPGTDATVSEGWRDLKVKNETDMTFQIRIEFNEESIFGILYTDSDMACSYEITGRDLIYFRKEGRTFEKILIYRHRINTDKTITENLLYENICPIGYQLSDDTVILEKE